MTDKLIEKITADRDRGFQSVWSPTLQELQNRILADAEAIKAAEKMSKAFDALIYAVDYPDADAGELVMSSIRPTLTAFREAMKKREDG